MVLLSRPVSKVPRSPPIADRSDLVQEQDASVSSLQQLVGGAGADDACSNHHSVIDDRLIRYRHV